MNIQMSPKMLLFLTTSWLKLLDVLYCVKWTCNFYNTYQWGMSTINNNIRLIESLREWFLQNPCRYVYCQHRLWLPPKMWAVVGRLGPHKDLAALQWMCRWLQKIVCLKKGKLLWLYSTSCKTPGPTNIHCGFIGINYYNSLFLLYFKSCQGLSSA